MRVPRKATWIRLATDPSFHFSFFLAERLHKTIREVEAMPNAEYMDWSTYYGWKAQQQELANRKG